MQVILLKFKMATTSWIFYTAKNSNLIYGGGGENDIGLHSSS